MSIGQKVQNILDDMFNRGEFNETLFNMKLDRDIEKKIKDYQMLHVFNIISSIKKNKIAIDGSWTGTGKTYTSIAVCAQLKLSPYIICPKTIMSTWKAVCEYFGVKPLGIVNYETIKSGKEYDEEFNKITARFLKIDEDNNFNWKFPSNNVLVILDEVHKCKHMNSINGKLLLSLKNKANILMLSATICDKIDDFIPFGYMLSLYKTIKTGKNWIQNRVKESNCRLEKTNILHKYIYPNLGSQMTLEDMGKKFPKNQISAECYYIGKKSRDKIDKYYNEMVKEKDSEKNGEKDSSNQIGLKVKLRKKIEEIKVPILFDLAKKYLEQDKSVVIFVNFINSLEMLMENFKESNILFSILKGEQDLNEREISIDNFQKNRVKVMIAMIQIGSNSINLHDLTGRSPRVSLISPSFSSIELLQCLGRIHRSGIKSPSLQRIIFCSSTYEEKICDVIKNKLLFMAKITDEDLFKI